MTHTASRKFAISVLITAAVLLLGLTETGSVSAQETGDDAFVDGEVVVKLDKASRTTIEEIYTDYPEVEPSRTETVLASSGIYLLRLQEDLDTIAVTEKMEGDGRLLYAELNFTTDAPEDSRRMAFRADSGPAPSPDPAPYRDQYAVRALDLPGTHKAGIRGTGTTVAVLDTGVQPSHEELAGGLIEGYDFIGDDADPAEEPNDKDDDRDGYVDEATGHGTHVAGIVHLAAPDAKIMPMRVLNSDGTGSVFVIAEAVQRAVDPDGRSVTDDGVDVINMSLGTSRESNLIRDVSDDLDVDDDDDGSEDDETGQALRGVPAEGVVVVGAAGNDDTEQRSYPAAEEGVIGVASVDQFEEKSDFSSYGSPQVDISAPGDDIHSLFPTDRYAEWDGTSMAAPFVAGQAALLRSVDPTLPATGPGAPGQPTVESLIKESARSIDAKNPDHAGKLGAGHADACASVKELRPAAACGSTEPPAVADTEEPPTVVEARPTASATGVTPRTRVSADFSEEMDEATIDESTFTLARRTATGTTGAPIPAAVRYDRTLDRAVLVPENRLRFKTTYVATATTGAKDPTGNALVDDEAWSFKTRR